ncbi:AAA family ATPase [Candidatus Sumerlaeota bacterium]|nr:AAA family ATPase [Candidatus Sumerlaeota bacterium]
MPPHLAGRQRETSDFAEVLKQEVILDNVVLTGLRGVGKTVLLETFKPIAREAGWLWAGADLSESSSISEEMLGTRMLTDLAMVTASTGIEIDEINAPGLNAEVTHEQSRLNYDTLASLYNSTPGLSSDKLKRVLEVVWGGLSRRGHHGLIIAYDEAQNLSDHAEKNQYPLSVLLDVFQSIQRKGIPIMLVLTGLPTLFPKLVDARTFAERMFRVLFLERLRDRESREAILRPIDDEGCPVTFGDESVSRIVRLSGGYPYFIQFICREVFEAWIRQILEDREPLSIPEDEIIRKLDSDFFVGRWSRATDRQRDLLTVVAGLDSAGAEFSIQEVVEASKGRSSKPFSSSHVNQMFTSLANRGLIYKNRHGKYSFAVPLMDQFIRRQIERN